MSDTMFLIQIHLQSTVPLLIREMKSEGGLQDRHLMRLHERSEYIGMFDESFLYRTPGQTAKNMNKLVEVLACLSFCPGGVTAFGLHFDAEQIKMNTIKRDDTLFNDLEACRASLERLEQEEAVDPYSKSSIAAIKRMEQEEEAGVEYH